MKSAKDADAPGAGEDSRAARAEKHLAARAGALHLQPYQLLSPMPEGISPRARRAEAEAIAGTPVSSGS